MSNIVVRAWDKVRNTEEVGSLRAEVGQLNDSYELLQETLADLKREDIGWLKLGDNSLGRQSTTELREKINDRAFRAWNTNPLAKNWVRVTSWFIVNAGITEVLRDMNGEKLPLEVQQAVRAEIREFKAANGFPIIEEKLSNELQLFGEIFIGLIADKAVRGDFGGVERAGSGRIRIVDIDPNQIKDIITDGSGKPVLFKRKYTKRVYNMNNPNEFDDKEVTEFLPAFKTDVEQYSGIKGFRGDMEVIHISINNITNSLRGVSDLYPALDWLRAYESWLTDRVRINKAAGMYVWKKKLTGTQRPGAAMSDRATMRGRRTSDRGGNTNPRPPLSGSVVIENQNTTWESVSANIRATDVSRDGRLLRLMIFAAAGLPEYFFADSETSNLATAKEMTRITERKFLFYRRIFTKFWSDVFTYATEIAIENTSRIPLEHKGNIRIEVNYPPLVTLDAEELVNIARANEIKLGAQIISRDTLMKDDPDIDDVEEENRLISDDAKADAARDVDRQTNVDREIDKKNAEGAY